LLPVFDTPVRDTRGFLHRPRGRLKVPDHRTLWTGRRLSRRELMTGGARLSAGLGAAWVLAACGGGSSASGSPGASGSPSQRSGTATLSTCPGWMGKDEVSAFKQKYPGTDINQVSGSSGATGSEVLFFRQNPGVYDFSLEDQSGVGQLMAGDLIEPV